MIQSEVTLISGILEMRKMVAMAGNFDMAAAPTPYIALSPWRKNFDLLDFGTEQRNFPNKSGTAMWARQPGSA